MGLRASNGSIDDRTRREAMHYVREEEKKLRISDESNQPAMHAELDLAEPYLLRCMAGRRIELEWWCHCRPPVRVPRDARRPADSEGTHDPNAFEL
jgi:hypothetical protein